MKRCPKCHQTYADDGLNFCLTDGETLISDLTPPSLKTTAVYSQPKGRTARRSFRWLTVVIAVIVLGAAGSYLYFSGGQTKSSRGANQNVVSVNSQPAVAPQPSVTQTPEEGVGALSTTSAPPTIEESPIGSPAASSASPNATPGTSPSPSGQNVKQKAESQFFTFELKQCRLSGASVACDLLITNNDRDRRLTIRRNSTIFDQEGNQYHTGRMQLANQEDSYGVSSYLISGVATKARVTFVDVSTTATKLTLMQLNFSVEDGPDFNIQYRDVPLR